ncbi:hypothetical protein CALK_1429 [Chitinivibrio alkaliphilus ACht1]|uniref:Uncharacterized protein n=1 Tax=Chitinivibrio alkaliphilus ACht1 TaxID=1313304 RepID=U7D7L0_9BACT|nr:hypothetical protein CALK_1429 [Chitinivibrio alkaliphilus ACht1]
MQEKQGRCIHPQKSKKEDHSSFLQI